MRKILFIILTKGPNVIKLFTAVIYFHSMVILSFCVKKNISIAVNTIEMAVNNPDKKFYNIGKHKYAVIYRSILTLELVGLK
jgi:hypothetical protein